MGQVIQQSVCSFKRDCCFPSALCVGWKFGAVFGRSGVFPTERVHPVAPPDFLSLPLDRKAEPRGGADQFAVSSAVAVAVASTMAAHEIDHTIEVHQHTVVCCFFVSVKHHLYIYFTVFIFLLECFIRWPF